MKIKTKLVLLVKNGFKMCITATSFAFLMGERLMRSRLAMIDLIEPSMMSVCSIYKPFVHSKQPCMHVGEYVLPLAFIHVRDAYAIDVRTIDLYWFGCIKG